MGNYQGYQKYQDSGVEWLGDIPEHWEVKHLKNVASITRGAILRPVNDPSYFDENGEWLYLNISDVTKCEKFLYTAELKLSDIGSKKSARVLENNLILTASATIGIPIINKVKVCIHDGFIAFKEIKTNLFFLYYVLLNKSIYSAMGKTNTQKNIYLDEVKIVKIGFPPLDEQEKIAQFLDYKTKQIDELIKKKETLIEKLDEKRTAIISHAVTKGLDSSVPMKDSGIEWLGNIPEHWKVKRFKFLLSQAFKYGANEAAEIDDPNLPRYIRITDVKDDGNLRDDTFRSLPEEIAKDYILEEGDILLARSGATVGKTFIYRKSWGKAAYAGYLIRARVSGQNNSDFIYKFLQSKFYFDWVKSIFIQATIQNISAEKYSNLFIPVPLIYEQKQIAEYLDQKTTQIDQQKAKIKEAIELLKEYRTSLITNAVTGKIDVSQIAIPSPQKPQPQKG
ncbi:MAG: restriction endonuclease subunit S [Dolichospermum sp.]